MSRRYRPNLIGRTDITVYIPQAAKRGGREQRALRACRWLWSRGIYPSPAAMGLRLYGHAVRSLSAIETKIRNRFLATEGIPRQRAVPEWIKRLDAQTRACLPESYRERLEEKP